MDSGPSVDKIVANVNYGADLSQVISKISDIVKFLKIIAEYLQPDNSWSTKEKKEAIILITQKLVFSLQQIEKSLAAHKASMGKITPDQDKLYRALEVEVGKIKVCPIFGT